MTTDRGCVTGSTPRWPRGLPGVGWFCVVSTPIGLVRCRARLVVDEKAGETLGYLRTGAKQGCVGALAMDRPRFKISQMNAYVFDWSGSSLCHQ